MKRQIPSLLVNRISDSPRHTLELWVGPQPHSSSSSSSVAVPFRDNKRRRSGGAEHEIILRQTQCNRFSSVSRRAAQLTRRDRIKRQAGSSSLSGNAMEEVLNGQKSISFRSFLS